MSRFPLLFAFLVLVACSSQESVVQLPNNEEEFQTTRYQATIRWTQYGIPHILAHDVDSAVFAQGYACGKMNLWTLAEQFVKVRSESARYFGPGPQNANIITDFAYKTLGLYERATEGFDRLDDEIQGLYFAYAAGYNKALQERKPAGCPFDCPNLDWVKPITALDLFAYSLQASLFKTSARLLAPIISAQPPQRGPVSDLPSLGISNIGLGSNAVAFGRDRTDTGNGLLLANPHFPWDGALRMFEVHLKVPGELNVSGVSLLGTPMVTIGFNEDLGWTHTVCTAQQGTLYRLNLVAGDPTSYYYDGQVRQMTPRQHRIEVLQPDGSIGILTRTSWHSHYGPILAAEGLEWTKNHCYVYKDANLGNLAMADLWYRVSRSKNLEEFRHNALVSYGVPWVNTVAADRTGQVFYADFSSVPNLSSKAVAALRVQLQTDPVQAALYRHGITLLDGSRSTFEWEEDDWHRPGLVSLEKAPQLIRTDLVCNSNDSHWLSNPLAPLEGFSPLYGPERSERSLRTRQALRLFNEETFDFEKALVSFDDTHSLSAEILLDDLLARCQGLEQVQLEDGTEVRIGEACRLLGDWDRSYQISSVGACIWREFITQFKDGDRHLASSLYQVPFNPEDPIETPARLALELGADPYILALAKGVRNLERVGVALNSPLGELQFSSQGDKRVPLPGGTTIEGVFNVHGFKNLGQGINLPAAITLKDVVNPVSHLSPEGYPCNFGASFCMVAEFTPEGPKVKGRLTYSQSSDPSSEHFSDQAFLETEGKWRDLLFKEEEILADPGLRIQEVRGN